MLQELAEGKREGQALIAAGCLVQRNGDEVLRRVPQVDGLLGTRRWMEVLELLRRIRGDGGRSTARYELLGEGLPGGSSAGPAGRPRPRIR